MEEALEMARAKDTKERMAGVERLYELLEASRKSLSSSEVTSLVDCCLDLLKDNNFRVSQGALQSLASAAVLSGEHLKLHFNAIVPAVVDRLGDSKQPVRDAARRLLLTLMEVSSPTIIVERTGSYAWMHKSWRVREEFARTVSSAIGLFASTELPLQRVILPPMLNDSNHGVREAAILCIEVKDINARLEKIEPKISSSNGLAGSLAPGEMKSASLGQKKNSPKAKSSTRETSLVTTFYYTSRKFLAVELVSLAFLLVHILMDSQIGESDATERPIDPVKVYSEKELIREIEKIVLTLVPEKDWSIRIAAMQRVEGLVFGGDDLIGCIGCGWEISKDRSTDAPIAASLCSIFEKDLTTSPCSIYEKDHVEGRFCCRGHLSKCSSLRSACARANALVIERYEVLVSPWLDNIRLIEQANCTPFSSPLINDVIDTKQACHLLNLLSKELLGDFEACAEIFIPVLFKLVVITVLVIAESADNCIKTMLRNCKVARVLPRIANCAKNDRGAALRARCCEYALLILEYWADAPEIQRSADLYEDLIKCCVADAMSEVRSTARTCYRMFTKTWPERSRTLFLSFDPVIQRIINEEDGGMHRRYASPSLHERGLQMSRTSSQTPTPSNLPGYGTSAIVAMDRSASLPAGTSLSSGLLLPQTKSLGKGTERSLQNVLHASKQKVTAIESMLRGLDISEKHNSSTLHSTSLDLGVDPPSARDPPFPPAVPASNHLTYSELADSTASSMTKGSNHNGGLLLFNLITTQTQALNDPSKLSYLINLTTEPLSALSLSYTSKRAPERLHERSSIEENFDIRAAKQYMNTHMDRQYVETPYKDSSFRDSHNNYIPNFQRPLLRKHLSGRVSASSRNSFDDSQLSLGEMSSYMDGPASLYDALTEGLGPSSDWCARVAAFNYLQTLLQQGPKGILEVTQSFEKVMKLFFQHLDDPHHKVAQAALSTLADIIPACRKPFESYMERILPHVFSRLIDPKELVRQPCSTTLEIMSMTYGIDSLLPALVRSLDEQRSPKAKLAVIEFATSSFNKHAMNSEGPGNSGMLKLWLAKLTPLVHDKNTKLKEAAITCIISVFNHYDSPSVLNFILSLSVEEQNSLRRALKQYTPRIEVDLMNFLQNKKERQRPKSFYDPSDVIGTSSEEGYTAISKKSHFLGRYSAGSIDSDSGRKWSSTQESTQITGSIGQAASDETHEHFYQNLETGCNSEVFSSENKHQKYNANATDENLGSMRSLQENMDHSISLESSLSTPCLDINGLENSDYLGVTGFRLGNGAPEVDLNHEKLTAVKINSTPDSGPSIPQILHQISNGNDESSSASKCGALQQLVEASMANDHSIWTKYFNQILTVVLEVLDDSDSSIRELALSLIVEMLRNQKDTMEDSVEIVIEKLLHGMKDMIAKVSTEAERCLTIVLSQYDPFRCLTVIVPLLVSEDEKTLATCINCLTKLVGRLSQEDLMAQLPSFLPSLFDAFGNQSADVRKTVVFCLVDIYIMLGKAFLPYLEGLNSTQLRLVTIYANRISQARTGAGIDSNHG
ncbi:hypothetical protein HHK36_022425 [Tetracentron sinense]|uniref:TOG domain-containing protein n=1 Tax=Tetracentron sinense TaxID=13715 RepID=A0A834YMZ3_TETSI|nr:hypothetical protein HHK36_022425 [Tetracentron sinense]